MNGANMQKKEMIERLKARGFRMTKQRQILLDILANEQCTCCKEIYYKAIKQDETIGLATVYRMISTLEEVGALSKNAMFQLRCGEEGSCGNGCYLEFTDGTALELSESKWNEVIQAGLKQCGYEKGAQIRNVTSRTCSIRSAEAKIEKISQ
jgi:Fur family ferric uptake transcriptional regulator